MFLPAWSSGMILAIIAKRCTSDLVGSGRRWSRLDWAATPVAGVVTSPRRRLAGKLRTGGVVPHSSSWTASAYEPQNRQLRPRCRRVTSRTAGYDCVNNATVRELKGGDPRTDHTRKETTRTPGCIQKRLRSYCQSMSPRSRGVGTPRVAGPLTTSLRGLWVSGLLPPGNGGPC